MRCHPGCRVRHGPRPGRPPLESRPDPDRAGRIVAGEDFDGPFPGISAVAFTAEGTGRTLSLRLTTKEGIPVRLVPERIAGASVVGVRRVNELDFYSLGRKDLTEKLGLSPNKTTAAIWDQRIQDDDHYFREIKIGSIKFKRSSSQGLHRLKDAIAAEGTTLCGGATRRISGRPSKQWAGCDRHPPPEAALLPRQRTRWLCSAGS